MATEKITYNGNIYLVDNDSKQATLIEWAASKDTTTITIPSNFTITDKEGVSTKYTVTGIGNDPWEYKGPFRYQILPNLTTIIIPNTITKCTQDAFYLATKLQKVIIEDLYQWATQTTITSHYGSPFFYGAELYKGTSIESASLISTISADTLIIPEPEPEKDPSIGIQPYVFFGCSSLTKIIIPTRVTSMGVGAFARCANLATIQVEQGHEYYSVASGCLYNNSKTFFYLYPAGSSVTSFEVPNTVTEIGPWAFSAAHNLQQISLSDGLTTISSAAFYDCDNIDELEIPNSVTTMGTMCFQNCTKLKKLILPSELSALPTDMCRSCSALTEVTLPNNLTSIATNALAYCSSLVKISLPSTVTSIGNYAFRYGSKLKDIDLSNITSIGQYAF